MFNRPYLAGTQDVYALSENLWHDCPLRAASTANRLGRGLFWGTDFDDIPVATQAGRIVVTANSGTFTLADQAYGVGLLTGTTTGGQGPNIQFMGSELFKAVAGQTIWGEGRFQFRTSPSDFFFGLTQTSTTAVTDGTPSTLTGEGVGIKAFTNDYAVLGICKDGSATTSSSALGTPSNGAADTTIYATTWVKLGFKIIGTTLVEWYYNGVKITTSTTNISVTELRPTLVAQSSTTTASIAAVDWLAFCQDRSDLVTTA